MLIASIINNTTAEKKLKFFPPNSLFKDLTLQKGKLRTHIRKHPLNKAKIEAKIIFS